MEIESLITAEYYDRIPREEIIKKSKFKYSLDELSSLGSGFTVAAAAIAEAAKNANSTEGLYRCYFPDGVTGKLAAFKDGSGLLGTIVNKSGIKAQARFVPVEGASVIMSVQPVTLAVAIAMLNVNKKLDEIKERNEEILHFLHQDKESELEGSINSLADTLEQYRFNSDNESWKNAKLSAVTLIKGKAESNIIFYRKEISDVLEKRKMLRGNLQADKIKAELSHKFNYYQLSVYLSAYASFLEVILGGNFSKDYLDHMSEKIFDDAYQYGVDYSDAYKLLKKYMSGTVEAKALRGIGKVGKNAGRMIDKIPVIRKGPVDEALIAAGGIIEKLGDKHRKSAMEQFKDKRDAGTVLFLSNIDTINEMSNRPVEILFDRENVYICSDE